MQATGADRTINVAVTLLCWLYFTLGFLLFFAPRYLIAVLVPSTREYTFQRCNRSFYRGFFALLRLLAPRIQWQLDERIATIRSAVIVCNHRSYLDPLLLIALLDHARTIVKPVFFAVPIFGWVIRASGYVPAEARGRYAGLVLARMASMGAYFAGGGSLFVFPEGTRGRNASVGPLQQGALKIARQHQVPVYVLCLTHTDRVFTPGRFFFHTTTPTCISVQLVDRIDPEEYRHGLAATAARVAQSLSRCRSADDECTTLPPAHPPAERT